MELSDLGARICVIGQSGSDKSTLAEALGRKCLLPVVHLDQYRHIPGTRFEQRTDEDFQAFHEAAILEDKWVIDGNYCQLWPRRLKRATGLLLLDVSTPRSLFRYVRRTLRSGTRIGGLGTHETLSWEMIHYIAFRSAANRSRRLELFHNAEVPKILLAGARTIDRFSESEQLTPRR